MLCDPQSAAIVYANEQAEKWFGRGLAGQPLISAISAVSMDDLTSRLAAGRRYSVTGEISAGSQAAASPTDLRQANAASRTRRSCVCEIENISTRRRSGISAAILFRPDRTQEPRDRARAGNAPNGLLMNVFPVQGASGVQGIQHHDAVLL